ncbi:Mariner Mos1 transposase [Eumeta japonica]|uniref:Mariner Mos1 transposase n=1 Tax=Eumeta variegata TaxID=151549 RepID=A0A4C1XX77_EUMVA|nr:Mariner Mos1 transposase [Eumeta japonica]
MLHHVNTIFQAAKRTNKFLKEKNVELMSNAAYSPDLPPCDFYLFAKIKNQLRDQRFSSPEEAVKEKEKDVFQVTNKEWLNVFKIGFFV